MVQKLNAFYDGRHFTPIGPVDIEPGSDVELTVTPLRQVRFFPYERPLTENEERAWAEMTERFRTQPPDPPTLEACMDEIRGR